jgi:hypothetical protein
MLAARKTSWRVTPADLGGLDDDEIGNREIGNPLEKLKPAKSKPSIPWVAAFRIGFGYKTCPVPIR